MKYRLSDLTLDTGPQLDELMRLVWPGLFVSPETVSQRSKMLRDALDDDSRLPRYIGTGFKALLRRLRLPHEA